MLYFLLNHLVVPTENIFSSEELTAWETRLRLEPDFRFYIDGQLERINNVVSFKSNVRLAKEGKKFMIIYRCSP